MTFITADQILAHLVGDYILQSRWMANEKTKRSFAAAVHAVTYTLPFLFLTQESKLGGKLFNHGQFKTRLTELGELVKPRIRRISREAAHACQVARKYATQKSAVKLSHSNSAEITI